jgi:oligosaccharide repeat unit polymerase
MWPLAVWSVVGVAMLVIGMRAETLVPVVAFVIVLRYRGMRIRRSVLVAGVVTLLVLIPMLRVTRQVGLENASDLDLSATSPLETFTELGGTLRAVKAYVDYIDRGGDYRLGRSYLVPFDRQVLARVVPGREQTPIETDPRSPDLLIVGEGAVGLSATGEAYYNFGPVGPFIFFGLVGVLFGWLERRAATTPYHCGALGVVMCIFFFNIRSNWLPVPAQFALTVSPMVICYLLNRLRIRASAGLQVPAFFVGH